MKFIIKLLKFCKKKVNVYINFSSKNEQKKKCIKTKLIFHLYELVYLQKNK